VKATNPSMGVCEVSAAIGHLWRELGPEEKQRHNNDYAQDKVSVVYIVYVLLLLYDIVHYVIIFRAQFAALHCCCSLLE